MTQGDLFVWADSRPAPVDRHVAVVIDALPHILRRIRIEKAYNIPRPKGGGDPIPLKRVVA